MRKGRAVLNDAGTINDDGTIAKSGGRPHELFDPM
jgi:hypothetical protein